MPKKPRTEEKKPRGRKREKPEPAPVLPVAPETSPLVLAEGGRIVDEKGVTVAVDADMGVAEHPFGDLEQIAPWNWDAPRRKLMEAVLEGDKTLVTVTKLAEYVGVGVPKIKEWMAHPAFVRVLMTKQAEVYQAISALRRNAMAILMDKLTEGAISLLDKNPANLSMTEAKTLSVLLKEFRSMRQSERVEHGEVTNIVAGYVKVDGSTSPEQSQVDKLLAENPELAKTLANALLDMRLGKPVTPMPAVHDAVYHDVIPGELPSSETLANPEPPKSTETTSNGNTPT